jgi:hypothetical protein
MIKAPGAWRLCAEAPATTERLNMDDDKNRRDKPEDEHDEPGAEGGSGGAANVPPAVPSDDDSALGDTDQHSDANA